MLARIVAELVRLDGLLCLADSRSDAAHGVFKRNLGDGCFQEQTDESQRIFRLSLPSGDALVPMQPAATQVGAGRVSHHQVPALPQYVTYVPLIVRPGHIGW